MSADTLTTSASSSEWQPRPLLSSEIRFGTWIAFFAWVFAVYDFVLFGTLLPKLGAEFGWSLAHQAAVATWIATGTAVVALLIGPLVDRLGRRSGIMFTVGGAAVCSALTAIGGAAGSVVLILIRSLSGLGYAEETVNATYLTELYAATDDPRLSRRRGFIYSLVQGGWPVGALLAAALTAILLPLIGWRGCFIFVAVPSLVVALLARRLRESPQFELLHEIRRLRESGQEGAGRSLASRHHVDYEKHAGAGLAAAFRGPALRATLSLGASFLLNWSTIQIFSVLGTTVITNVHHISFRNSLLILILSNLAGYCGYLTHGYFGDRIGRRNIIALGWMLGGVAFTAMLYGPHDIVFVVALYSIGLFFLTGPYSALLFFMGESFPTEIRATGGAIIHCMGPVGAILAGIGATRFLAAGADWQSAAFWFGAVPCFASGLVVLTARHVNPSAVR
jgi:MFS family permease